MISTLYGELDLLVYPTGELPVSTGGRVQICKVRGSALGQLLNVEVTLDVNTGELLLFSPEGYVGSFRLGDLVVAHAQQAVARAAAERREASHAAQTH